MLLLMLLGVSFKDAMICNYIVDLLFIIVTLEYGIWMHYHNKEKFMTSVNTIVNDLNDLFELIFKGR